jgi:hypothetical protein
MSQCRVTTVCLFLAALCAGISSPPAVAQREVDIDDERLVDFVEDMVGGEDEGLEGELAEMRAEAEATLTPALRAWIEKEAPGFLARLERHRRAMEAEGDIEALFESYELQVELPERIEELREAKAEAGEALSEELLAVLKREAPRVVARLDVDGLGEDAWPWEVLERTIDGYWMRAELAEVAEELRDMRQETAEVFGGEIREIVETELPDGIKLLRLLERRVSAPTDEPWEQIERRMRYYETHFHLAGLGEELRELSGEGGVPGEEDFDEPLERAAGFERFKRLAALNIACQLAALRYRDAQNATEAGRITRSLEANLGRAFDLSMERLREGELKDLGRELQDVERDEEGGDAMEIDTLKREIRRITYRLNRRQKNRDIIIYRRYVELIEGEDPYAWE